MRKKEKTMPHIRMSFAVTEKLKTELETVAAKQHITTSELIRNYIDKGMNVDKTKDDIDFIRKQIREELSLQLKPNTDRIMKMLMRIGMMAVTFSYFTGKIIYYFVPFSEKKSHDELMTEAKKNAAAYLSMRDETLDKAYKEFKDKN